MKIVYLDQNRYIELARAANGSPRCEEDAKALTAIRHARDSSIACFPLSYGHFIETKRRRNVASATNLMDLMLDISDGLTLSSDMIFCELDQALQRVFPSRIKEDAMTPFNLLGYGWQHADPLNALLTQLFGIDRIGSAEGSFARGLAELKTPLSEEQRENVLYSRAMSSVREPLVNALARHGISISELRSLGEARVRSFLDDLPSVRLDIHLHRQWSKNRTLRVQRNDAYDFVYVGQALTYCDVVVTEKQLADLVHRDGFTCRAKVMTSLAELQSWLKAQQVRASPRLTAQPTIN